MESRVWRQLRMIRWQLLVWSRPVLARQQLLDSNEDDATWYPELNQEIQDALVTVESPIAWGRTVVTMPKYKERRWTHKGMLRMALGGHGEMATYRAFCWSAMGWCIEGMDLGRKLLIWQGIRFFSEAWNWRWAIYALASICSHVPLFQCKNVGTSKLSNFLPKKRGLQTMIPLPNIDKTIVFQNPFKTCLDFFKSTLVRKSKIVSTVSK